MVKDQKLRLRSVQTGIAHLGVLIIIIVVIIIAVAVYVGRHNKSISSNSSPAVNSGNTPSGFYSSPSNLKPAANSQGSSAGSSSGSSGSSSSTNQSTLPASTGSSSSGGNTTGTDSNNTPPDPAPCPYREVCTVQ